ncbi:MAG: sulfoxide reductase heme-binding subunit YedZ [Glaciecola sp.]|jgi:sulfoxide reductase heme-binding subunit YedZ
MSSMIFKKPIRIGPTKFKIFQWMIHIFILAWLILIFYQGLTDQLGGDPVQSLLDFTGIGALNLLVISLVISPIASYLKFGQVIQLRRPIGLYSAFYALSHLMVFIAFELQFEMVLVLSEIIERPYITVGFTTFIILSILAITSISNIKKKMGRKWFTLHSLSYIAVILGGIHYLWLVKSAWYEPAIYIIVSMLLILLRRKKIIKMFK